MQKVDFNEITVTIPAYKEPEILRTLSSLINCNTNGINLKVRVLINNSLEDSFDIKKVNEQSFGDVSEFIHNQNIAEVYSVGYREFPAKDAGVGLARKTLMDRAALEYKEKSQNGIILALDADCTVESNYLQAVSKYFQMNHFAAASIHFEHPIDDKDSQKAIIEYEWHLRYFIKMQAWCGFPFAFQTVGSSMACLSKPYLAKGGMNKRKAGEDFYFLQKFIKDGVCGKIINTCVYPSGRISDRVPFGTGRAMGKYGDKSYKATSYNPRSFVELKKMNAQVDYLFESEPQSISCKSLDEYLASIKYESKVAEIRRNVSSKEAFLKRYYQFFDAFQLMKCLHYMRTEYPDLDIEQANEWYSEKIDSKPSRSVYESLTLLRQEFI